MALKAVIVLSAVMFYVAHGYSSGAPTTACDTLLPNHDGRTAQNKLTVPVESPYQVNVVGNYLVENDAVVTMTLDGTQDFKGFVLVSEYIDDNGHRYRVGTWASNETSVQFACGDTSGLTHKDSGAKRGLVVQWKAPAAPFTGYASFWASFVQDKHTFWIEIQGSISVLVGPIPTTTTTVPPTTTKSFNLPSPVFPDPVTTTAAQLPSSQQTQTKADTTTVGGGIFSPADPASSNIQTSNTGKSSGSVLVKADTGASSDVNGASPSQISILCMVVGWLVLMFR